MKLITPFNLTFDSQTSLLIYSFHLKKIGFNLIYFYSQQKPHFSSQISNYQKSLKTALWQDVSDNLWKERNLTLTGTPPLKVFTAEEV